MAALLAADPYRREQVVQILLADEVSDTRTRTDPFHHVAMSALGFALAGAVLLLWDRVRRRPRAGLVLLAAHAVVLLGWKVMNLRDATVPLGDEHYALQRLEGGPYRPRRHEDPEVSPRYRALAAPVFAIDAIRDNRVGAQHWTSDACFGLDMPSSRFATTDWSRPMDALLRALDGMSPDDLSRPPRSFANYRLTFPDSTGARRMAAVTPARERRPPAMQASSLFRW
jgi:hypothetical protein